MVGQNGDMSYVAISSFRTIEKPLSPVSSPASRKAAASGDSPDRMLPAETWTPTFSKL